MSKIECQVCFEMVGEVKKIDGDNMCDLCEEYYDNEKALNDMQFRDSMDYMRDEADLLDEVTRETENGDDWEDENDQKEDDLPRDSDMENDKDWD